MNPLIDIVGRQILLRLGYTPDQIATGLQKMKAGLPDQNPRINPKGQTNLFSQAGNPRNFRSGGAVMSPTLSPVESRGATLNPRPTYPGRPSAPGQMSIFGTNPGATVTARNLLQAPNIPPEGSATKPNPRSNPFLQTPKVESGVGTKPQFKPNLLTRGLRRLDNVGRNSYNRVVGVANKPRLGKGGALVMGLGVADFVQDIVLQRFFPETYELKQANKIGGTDPTMSTTREDIRAQRETLKQVQETLAKPPVETPPSPKKVSPAAALQVTTDDNPAPMPAPRQRVQPKPRVAPVAATAPVAPKESAYGASGKELYMKAKGQNPLMKRYFGENYATDKVRKFT